MRRLLSLISLELIVIHLLCHVCDWYLKEFEVSYNYLLLPSGLSAFIFALWLAKGIPRHRDSNSKKKYTVLPADMSLKIGAIKSAIGLKSVQKLLLLATLTVVPY